MKIGQLNEAAVALLDLLHRERAQTVDTEVLDRKRRDYAAVNDRAPETAARSVAGAREVPEQAAGEGVAGAGRIEDFFQGIRWHGENRRIRELQNAVFAALDENRLRSHL